MENTDKCPSCGGTGVAKTKYHYAAQLYDNQNLHELARKIYAAFGCNDDIVSNAVTEGEIVGLVHRATELVSMINLLGQVAGVLQEGEIKQAGKILQDVAAKFTDDHK